MSIIVLRLADVTGITGLSRSTIYRLIDEGRFPAPIPLTRDGRAVGWVQAELDEYLQQRIEQRSEVRRVT